MPSTRFSLVTRSLAVSVALAATLSLTGCFSNPLDQLGDKISEGVAKNTAEKLVKDATGMDVDVTSHKLPKDFPKDVPVIKGTIRTSLKTKGEGKTMWSLLLTVKDGKASINEARSQLTSAGFEETLWNEGTLTMGAFAKGDLSVMVTSTPASGSEETASIAYTVMKGKD